MLEHVVYDADGQLLTATFMDYAMPRAEDMPWVGFTSEPVPSTQNPMGMKGCGEAGTVGALAAVANAGLDALADRGIRIGALGPRRIRVVTHMDVGAADEAQLMSALGAILG